MVISIQILTTIMMLWRGGFFCQMCLWMGCRHGQIGDSCIILKNEFWLVNVLHKSILWHSKQRLFSAQNWYDGIKTSQYGVDDDDKDKIRDRSSAAKRESRQPLLVIDVNMWQDEQHTWCLLLMSIYLLSQYTPLDKCTYLLMPIYLFLMTRCDNMNSFIDLNTSFKSIYPPLMLIYLLLKCQYTCYWCQYVTR